MSGLDEQLSQTFTGLALSRRNVEFRLVHIDGVGAVVTGRDIRKLLRVGVGIRTISKFTDGDQGHVLLTSFLRSGAPAASRRGPPGSLSAPPLLEPLQHPGGAGHSVHIGLLGVLL